MMFLPCCDDFCVSTQLNKPQKMVVKILKVYWRSLGILEDGEREKQVSWRGLTWSMRLSSNRLWVTTCENTHRIV